MARAGEVLEEKDRITPVISVGDSQHLGAFHDVPLRRDHQAQGVSLRRARRRLIGPDAIHGREHAGRSHTTNTSSSLTSRVVTDTNRSVPLLSRQVRRP